MLRVVKLAGNYVKEQILSSFVRLIATSPDLQTYSVQRLYAALKADITQEALTLAGTWVIGEYGDLLLQAESYEEDELVKEVRESDLVDLWITHYHAIPGDDRALMPLRPVYFLAADLDANEA